MPRLNSPRMKLAFEISQQFSQLRWCFNSFKSFGGVKNFGHLGKVGCVVRAQKNFAARRERGAGERGKLFIDEPILMVAGFWPGIGKIDVDCRSGMRRQKILEEIGGFDSDAANIVQPGAAALAVQFRDSAQQPFDADKVCFWMPSRQFDEKGSIAATEFDFQRLRLLEKGTQRERRDDGAQFDNQAVHRN